MSSHFQLQQWQLTSHIYGAQCTRCPTFSGLSRRIVPPPPPCSTTPVPPLLGLVKSKAVRFILMWRCNFLAGLIISGSINWVIFDGLL